MYVQMLLFICCLLFSSLSVAAQDSTTTGEKQKIEAVVKQLFNGMRAGDSLMVKELFTPEATLSSIFTNRQNEVVKRSNSASGFVTAIGEPHDEVWDEQIWSYDVKMDGPMAQVWTEYTFYLGNKMSHCGVNVFEMIHLQDGWKISAITDTRRKTDCITKVEAEVDVMMDDWHNAAATADELIFFGSMTDDAVYIGTDASERWTRGEMIEWSKEYFKRESAWSFTTVSRNVLLNEAQDMGWFDELLDTWMGPCRGSGVVVKTAEGWKIKHYHLSIAVPNDQVDGYLNLIGKSRPK